MEAIAVYNTTDLTATRDLQPLFENFVSYIGRGEKTTRTYITNLKQFAAWLKYENIVAPVRADIINYRDYLLTEHKAIILDPFSAEGWRYRTDSNNNIVCVKCAANTVKQYLQSVKQFFIWAAANNYYPNIAANIHAPKIRQDNHKKDALSAQDVLTIENNISLMADKRRTNAAAALKDTQGRIDRATEQGKRLFAMYLLAVNCGLRTIEISRANIKDIEVKNGTACLYVYGKGHAEADTKKTLAPAVYEAIKDYLNSRTDAHNTNSPLFVSTGNRSGGSRIAPTTISKMLKKAMQEAGYNSDRITAHSLRHTAGTNVQELTGNIYLTQQYMRHANPATTEIYLHNNTEKQEASIAQRLYNFYHGADSAEDSKANLENIISSMSQEQLQQLTSIAAAMAK